MTSNKSFCAKAALSMCVLALWSGYAASAQTLGSSTNWPYSKLVQKWKVNHGGDSTPVFADDKLYVLTGEGDALDVLYCLNAGDGSELWATRYHSGGSVTTPAPEGHPGPSSTPIMAGDNIAVLGRAGTLVIINAKSGAVVSSGDATEQYPKYFNTRSPVVVGEYCIAHQTGKHDDETTGAMTCVEIATGKPRWSVNCDAESYTSPVVMTNGGTVLVIVQTQKSIAALDLANGKVLWKEEYDSNGFEYNAAKPVVDGQTLIYSGVKRGTIAARLEKDGDKFKAAELWSNPNLTPQFSTFLLKEGLLYALNRGGNFICVNARTGKTAWTEPLGGHDPYASLADGGAVIYATTPKSELIVFQPGDKAYTELANLKVADKPVFAAPAVAGNRVFIRSQDTVSLWVWEK